MSGLLVKKGICGGGRWNYELQREGEDAVMIVKEVEMVALLKIILHDCAKLGGVPPPAACVVHGLLEHIMEEAGIPLRAVIQPQETSEEETHGPN